MNTAIVVDDEVLIGNWLAMKLNETGKIVVRQIIHNPLELIDHIQSDQVDVVFLDIEMPQIKGTELARLLSTIENPPEIVFVSAHESYTLDAFRVNAMDYLLKPVHDLELYRVLEKVEKRIIEKEKLKRIVLSKVKQNSPISFQQMNIKFPTLKCEELFIYMLLRGKEPISKWKIIEDLWPEKEAEKGESNIRTTVFRLNQAMSEAGWPMKVKATKGSYQLIYANNLDGDLTLLPSIESLDPSIPITTIMKNYNLLSVLQEKEYIWAVGLKQKYEDDFYQWSKQLLATIGMDQEEYYLALKYLLGIFPWREQLILQIMPLIQKWEGKAALINFYKNHEIEWKELYDMPLSLEIINHYNNLIRE